MGTYHLPAAQPTLPVALSLKPISVSHPKLSLRSTYLPDCMSHSPLTQKTYVAGQRRNFHSHGDNQGPCGQIPPLRYIRGLRGEQSRLSPRRNRACLWGGVGSLYTDPLFITQQDVTDACKGESVSLNSTRIGCGSCHRQGCLVPQTCCS
jgi:hypothetical protein